MKRFIFPVLAAVFVLLFALFCGYAYAGAWPTDNITTTHVDAATDDPSQARAEIYTTMLRVKDVIGAKGSANGVAPLDASALVPLANIPNTLTGKSADTLDGINSTSFARVDAASNFTTAPTISSNTVWHAGNDGTGSGLDADLLDGYQSGNASGQIPISNGTVSTNLNADLLDGVNSTSFARVDAASNFTTAPTISGKNVMAADNAGGGVMYRGRVTSSGTAQRLPAGWTSTNIGTGRYRIQTNLTTDNYTVVVSAASSFGDLQITYLRELTFYSFVVGIATTSGTAVNNDFSFFVQTD